MIAKVREVLSGPSSVDEKLEKLFSKDSQGKRIRIRFNSRDSFEANLGPRQDEEVSHIRGKTTYPAWCITNSGFKNAKIVLPVLGQRRRASEGEAFRALLVSGQHEDVSVGVCFLEDE
tara:strand:- start:421212 stop:421565 length:354 start_codon:yes stop_codon:yes gene_type:complete